jgi:hypothetical protein
VDCRWSPFDKFAFIFFKHVHIESCWATFFLFIITDKVSDKGEGLWGHRVSDTSILLVFRYVGDCRVQDRYMSVGVMKDFLKTKNEIWQIYTSHI